MDSFYHTVLVGMVYECQPRYNLRFPWVDMDWFHIASARWNVLLCYTPGHAMCDSKQAPFSNIQPARPATSQPSQTTAWVWQDGLKNWNHHIHSYGIDDNPWILSVFTVAHVKLVIYPMISHCITLHCIPYFDCLNPVKHEMLNDTMVERIIYVIRFHYVSHYDYIILYHLVI